ncbi:phosphoglycerol transferase [Alcanivorax hongdengensis A-11-3]|uniref:Phosphoglycerol transferase n=1 Tax=Alcanivorax hongdengensis A-11-3 TaxID=1177179 RepID=L0WEB1_9GAMM|nr:LTA synthase family protein [Alcanivorax hongdengensis]EKF75064.1 phosphoglycerol transferase [Alcanivorax hongdengensis A-11-3]
MTWCKSRRLHYLLAIAALLFAVMLALRAVFYFGFSPLSSTADAPADAIWHALGVGIRFDLRLALLLVLPLAALAWFPRFNLVRSPLIRGIGRVYLALVIALLLLTYIFDFGHYVYLGDRLNITALRFLEDTAISTEMVWESYPVVWITLGWLLTSAVIFYLALRLEKTLLDRQGTHINGWQATVGGVVVFVGLFFGLLGRASDINFENPVPLRWSEAFVSGNKVVGALGLNPVLYLYDTSVIPTDPYDMDKVKRFYPRVAAYLDMAEADRHDLNFDRLVSVQPHRLSYDRPPNIVVVMLESLGASRVGAYGTPYNPTPNLDALADKGWFFEHFYVPVTGTAKTIWAFFTGIPDVTPRESASRNPLTSHQRMLVNEFKGYRKFYFVGGNAGWANLDGLIKQSIDGLELYQEGDWKSPNVDVWGISDLNLFRESNAILDQVPAGQPFFAYIQTAGNHRPFTIPEQNGDFQVRDLPADKLAANGFRNAAQYNAVRLLDYNVGEYMKMARQSHYFDNTIFVFFGDHNNRITTIPHMPPSMEKLGLESNHVPHIIYSPRYLKPRRVEQAVSLLDVFPTLAGMMGMEYRNTTLGRDFQSPAPEGERAVYVIIQEGPKPIYGMVSKDYLMRMHDDGSHATLHDLSDPAPETDHRAEHPDVVETLAPLAQGIYEDARYLLYDNVDEDR